MNITPEMIHQLVAQTNVDKPMTGREATAFLKLHQVHIDQRSFRHYMTGRSSCPEVIFRALRDLTRELSELSDQQRARRFDTVRKTLAAQIQH